MQKIWSHIERRLAELGCLDAMALRSGADPQEIADLESHLGVTLPDGVARFLSLHDGQDGDGLIYGQSLLSVSGIRQQWDVWRSIDEEEMNADCAEFMASDPVATIKPMYCNRAWIPLTHDHGSNHFGLDFDPDQHGQHGQIIAFGRNEDTKRLYANSFEKFIEAYLSWLQSAEWRDECLDVRD